MTSETDCLVERVYGTIHSFEQNFFIHTQEGTVSPSQELLRDLNSLPEGSVVGIETFDPKEVRRLTKKVNGQRFYLKKEDDFYWKIVENYCDARNLQVAYLDDFSTFRAYVAKQLEWRQYRQEYEASLKERGGIGPAELAALADAAYRAAIETRYIHRVGREEKIIERIAKYHPQRVIIGRGHGDYLFSRPEALIRHRVSFGEYYREGWVDSQSRMMAELMYDHKITPHRQAQLVDRTPDPQELINREMLERAYRLITEGRVIADKTPDYVGTWDLRFPLRGYFEVYVNGQAKGGPLSGIIEDCLGTADFEGEISENWVQFLKTYQKDNSTANAIKMPILYKGLRKNGKYEGQFTCQGLDEDRGFILNEGTTLAR